MIPTCYSERAAWLHNCTSLQLILHLHKWWSISPWQIRSDSPFPIDKPHSGHGVVWLDITLEKLMCIEAYNAELTPTKICEIVNEASRPAHYVSSSFVKPDSPSTWTCNGEQTFVFRSYSYWENLPDDINEIIRLSDTSPKPSMNCKTVSIRDGILLYWWHHG